MKEYNIEALWKEDVAPESQFTLGYSPGAIKSKLNVFSELKRIRNLFWWEWLGEFAGIVLTVFFLMKSEDPISLIDVGFYIVYSAAIYYIWITYFINFVKGINTVPILMLKEAMMSYYNTLCDYIKRLQTLAYAILGISMVTDLINFFLKPDLTIGKFLFQIFTTAFGFVFVYAFIDGYYDYMYKDSKTEFEILLREMEDE